MAKITKSSINCAGLIKHFEGLFLKAYLCPANVWTIKVINTNPTNYPAIQTQWLRWNKANGSELKGLTRRRKSEFHYYQTGILKFDF